MRKKTSQAKSQTSVQAVSQTSVQTKSLRSKTAPAQSFKDLATFKLETLSSLTSKHGEVLYQRLYGLRLIECRILAVIAAYGPVTLRRLCIELELDKSQGSRIVAKLIEAGLIERLDDPADNRSFYLILTSQGVHLRNQINARAAQRNEVWLGVLSTEKQAVFLDCLKDLIEQSRTMLKQESSRSKAHPLPPQPTHELPDPVQPEKKPLLIEAETLMALHQQLGKLLTIKPDS